MTISMFIIGIVALLVIISALTGFLSSYLFWCYLVKSMSQTEKERDQDETVEYDSCKLTFK